MNAQLIIGGRAPFCIAVPDTAGDGAWARDAIASLLDHNADLDLDTDGIERWLLAQPGGKSDDTVRLACFMEPIGSFMLLEAFATSQIMPPDSQEQVMQQPSLLPAQATAIESRGLGKGVIIVAAVRHEYGIAANIDWVFPHVSGTVRARARAIPAAVVPYAEITAGVILDEATVRGLDDADGVPFHEQPADLMRLDRPLDAWPDEVRSDQ